MAHAIYYCAYKLKKGSSVPDFLQAAETLNEEYISKQRGYISWKQMVDGETWADMISFETMEDLNAFEEASQTPNAFALQFYAFINLNSCKVHRFSLEREYESN